VILYVNGDSHAAGAEAMLPHGWAEDDSRYWEQGRHPHPDNEAVSFGAELAQLLGCERINQSQSGGSNARIIRTTTEWIEQNPTQLADTFVLIQWSTWEREEWLHDNIWHQVNASGVDQVPAELEQQYREYIVGIDYYVKCKQSHAAIWEFHCYLKTLGINHLFFNGNSTFSDIQLGATPTSDIKHWGKHYINPYSLTGSYDAVLRYNGFDYVNPKTYHFGAKAHCFWAQYVLQYIKDNQLLGPDEIPSY
jgi:hypothetical protein